MPPRRSRLLGPFNVTTQQTLIGLGPLHQRPGMLLYLLPLAGRSVVREATPFSLM